MVVKAALGLLTNAYVYNLTLLSVGIPEQSRVVKISGHKDVHSIYKIGDLTEDDRALVLVTIEIAPSALQENKQKLDILQYFWSYKTLEGTTVSRPGTLSLELTENVKLVPLQEPAAVRVAVAMNIGTEKDLEILAHLSQGQKQAAIQVKSEICSLLEDAEKYDPFGLVKPLLQRHQTTLQMMLDSSSASSEGLIERSVDFDIYSGGHTQQGSYSAYAKVGPEI